MLLLYSTNNFFFKCIFDGLLVAGGNGELFVLGHSGHTRNPEPGMCKAGPRRSHSIKKFYKSASAWPRRMNKNSIIGRTPVTSMVHVEKLEAVSAMALNLLNSPYRYTDAQKLKKNY